MKRRPGPSAKLPRARDLAARRFEFWKKQSRNPKTLKTVRSTQLKHFEPHVEDVAKQLRLDPSRASDRELLLRMLSHVHSLRPHDNTLMRLSESASRQKPRRAIQVEHAGRRRAVEARHSPNRLHAICLMAGARHTFTDQIPTQAGIQSQSENFREAATKPLC
jgi:hypothetical protein